MASRAAVSPGQMGLWILGTTLVALIACTLAWGSYKYGDVAGLAAPPAESVQKIERVALTDLGRPES